MFVALKLKSFLTKSIFVGWCKSLNVSVFMPGVMPLEKTLFASKARRLLSDSDTAGPEIKFNFKIVSQKQKILLKFSQSFQELWMIHLPLNSQHRNTELAGRLLCGVLSPLPCSLFQMVLFRCRYVCCIHSFLLNRSPLSLHDSL